MSADVIALLGGLLFLLLALVGGGFTVKEIFMPTIPGWARAACLVVGVVLVVVSFTPLGSGPVQVATTDADAETSSVTSSSELSEEVVIHEDPDEWVARAHGLQVSGLRASARHEPLDVDDQIRIEFTLENVGRSPVTVAETFIGARAPGDRWADTGHENQGAVLGPGATLDISNTVLLDAPGRWEFWPCYSLETRRGDECPDEWRRFYVTVG